MKPPPRTRNKPARRADTLEDASERGGKAPRPWHVGEQKKLLTALKSLGRTAAGQTDLDYSHLEKCVPTRSASEIQDMVECLKRKVVCEAAAQLRRTTQEERGTWKPIEEWTHLAAAATGSLEQAISTAFLQMLIVSSTEPYTLQNWDPPRARTLSARPLQIKTLTSTPGPGASLGGTPPEQVTPTTPGSEAATAAANRSASGLASSLPAPPTPSPAPESPAPLLCGVHDVNFEKIYCYLSSIQKPSENYKLNPMESAVVLDLLASLPEELPLLDCNGLHEHMTKVHRCFSAPAKSKTAKQTFKELKDGHSAGAAQPEDAGATEVPPLNPFMVPLSLLRRR